jgi:hypothetical protein
MKGNVNNKAEMMMAMMMMMMTMMGTCKAHVP